MIHQNAPPFEGSEAESFLRPRSSLNPRSGFNEVGVPAAIITGSGGLIGSESVRRFISDGYDVIGLENDLRARFFGPKASTRRVTERLVAELPEFHPLEVDVRDADAVMSIFARHGRSLELVVHTAAQPSHDWAASDPQTDFGVNANGTLNLLEAARRHAPEATFVFTSTNKVYGDRPNGLPLIELETRFELPEGHPYHAGIDTSMSIDQSLHSLFGVSKAAADLMVQEYGRYFGLPTVCFRAGCLTGPNHAGAQLHGFLSYLMRCTVTGDHYTVFGYGGKQVRDNIHSADVVAAFAAFHASPQVAAVYNLGGGRVSNCSMLEAIALCERIADRKLDWSIDERARIGDHCWWISDLDEFRDDYPAWRMEYELEPMLREIYEQNIDIWTAVT
jgi:CDP-paratose 2-epimerase